MKQCRIKQTVFSCAVFSIGMVTHGQTVVFDADFQSSPAAADNLKNAVGAAARNTILDAGTSVGSWDDKDATLVNPAASLYEIADDELGNHVWVFSTPTLTNGNVFRTLADAEFASTVDLSQNVLSLSWDMMITDEAGGGNSSAFIDLLDSSDSVVATIRWNEGGGLLVDGTSVGTYNRWLLGNDGANLTSESWDPLSLSLDVSDSGITVTTDTTTHETITGSYSEVAALRFRTYSNRSFSQAGMWIDDIHAEFSAVPEPSTAAILAGMLALTSGLTRRRR